ncbi:hypothetical protein D3C74_407100 [compost metagenome]
MGDSGTFDRLRRLCRFVWTDDHKNGDRPVPSARADVDPDERSEDAGLQASRRQRLSAGDYQSGPLQLDGDAWRGDGDDLEIDSR